VNVTGILVARMDSRRLPGKVLEPVGGMPLVEVALRRAQRAQRLDACMLATTERAVDDPLVAWAANVGLSVYRGRAADVADRLRGAAREAGADYFLRMNGDSPFVAPDLIDEAIRAIAEHPIDLVSNLGQRRFPTGVTVELVRRKAFEEARELIDSDELREHATQVFYRHAGRFRVHYIEMAPSELSSARLVVDTKEDRQHVSTLADTLGPELLTAGWREIAKLAVSMNASAEPRRSS
jgi:spore coat polysaccharide biosynthesis protein SpsF (cytidylyltransferase family)